MTQTNHADATSQRQIFMGQVPEVYKQRFKESKIETNLSRMRIVAIFIIVVQVILNLINIVRPSTGNSEGVMKFVVLSLITLLLGIAFLIISILMKRGRLKNMRLRQCLPFVLLYSYTGIQMTFFAFNVLEANTGNNSFVIALLVMGLFVIMHPIQSFLSLLALFVLNFSIMYMFRDVSTMWDTVMVTDVWANTIIITALVIYISWMFFEMYVKNFLSKVRLEGSNQQLEEMAQTDSLTELLNRRGFFKTVDRQWEEYVAGNKLVAVCMLDIDRFKRFNDQYGHVMGDQCLRMVADCLGRKLKEVDGGVICRYGGEEFLALYRVEDGAHALAIAQDICRAVGQEQLPFPQENRTLSITISGGLAYGGQNSNCDILIKHADDALYRAKANGRNQVCVSDHSLREYKERAPIR